MKTIGFVGLGVMGAPMAGRLLSAGYSLRVWNRTAAKGDDLVNMGAARASTPAEAAAGADAVITMVADDAALREVTYGAHGLLSQMAPGTTHISMSTVSPEAVTELARAHRQQATELLCAPLFGSKEAAVNRKLFCIGAGPRDVFDTWVPALDVMAQGGVYVGEDPAAGARIKIIVNMLISTTVASLVQAFACGARSGIPAGRVMDVVRAVFDSPMYERYGGRLVSRDFDTVHFPLKLMLKDVELMLDLGAAAGVPLPHAAASREMIVGAIGQGFADQDAAGGLMQTWETLSNRASERS